MAHLDLEQYAVEIAPVQHYNHAAEMDIDGFVNRLGRWLHTVDVGHRDDDLALFLIGYEPDELDRAVCDIAPRGAIRITVAEH